MNAEDRIRNLESRLGRITKITRAAALLLVVMGLIAAGPLIVIVARNIEVKNAAGKTTASIRENGDVEIDGKLVVKNTDVLAELARLSKAPAPVSGNLQVAAVPVTLAPIPAHPAHGYWGITRGGAGPQSIINNATLAGQDANGFIQAAALINDTVDGEVVAAWITPTTSLHEAFNQDILIGRLETRIISNKVVVASSCVKRQSQALGAVVYILYRKKSP
jgi:hypothetical protein